MDTYRDAIERENIQLLGELRIAREERDRLRLALEATVETARKGEALRNAKIARMREALDMWMDHCQDDCGSYCCGTQCDDGTEHSDGCRVGITAALLKDEP